MIIKSLFSLATFLCDAAFEPAASAELADDGLILRWCLIERHSAWYHDAAALAYSLILFIIFSIRLLQWHFGRWVISPAIYSKALIVISSTRLFRRHSIIYFTAMTGHCMPRHLLSSTHAAYRISPAMQAHAYFTILCYQITPALLTYDAAGQQRAISMPCSPMCYYRAIIAL